MCVIILWRYLGEQKQIMNIMNVKNKNKKTLKKIIKFVAKYATKETGNVISLEVSIRKTKYK